MSEKDIVITFEESAKETILSMFDKAIDSDGFIIEKDTLQRVITSEGEEITLQEFAGIWNRKFIKSDLPSLIDLV